MTDEYDIPGFPDPAPLPPMPEVPELPELPSIPNMPKLETPKVTSLINVPSSPLPSIDLKVALPNMIGQNLVQFQALSMTLDDIGKLRGQVKTDFLDKSMATMKVAIKNKMDQFPDVDGHPTKFVAGAGFGSSNISAFSIQQWDSSLDPPGYKDVYVPGGIGWDDDKCMISLSGAFNFGYNWLFAPPELPGNFGIDILMQAINIALSTLSVNIGQFKLALDFLADLDIPCVD